MITFYLVKGLYRRLPAHFNSTVRVGVDGKLYVQEKITVNNGNGQPNPVYGMDSSLLAAGAMNNEIKGV